MNHLLSLLKKNIRDFEKDITDFCDSNKIEISLYNFLSYKEKDRRLPKNINRMLAMRMPKLYIASSYEFWKALDEIPSDFKKDIIFLVRKDKIKEFLLENFDIVDYLKNKHGKNYYNLLKKDKKKW